MRGLRFVRLPKYKSFDYEPRFYDPEQEDLKRRVQLIESELNKDGNLDNYSSEAIGQRISFARNRRTGAAKSSILIRLGIVAVLVLLFGSILFA